MKEMIKWTTDIADRSDAILCLHATNGLSAPNLPYKKSRTRILSYIVSLHLGDRLILCFKP